MNKDTKELTEKWVLTHKYDNQTNTAIYTTDIPEIEIEKVEVRAQGRKLSQPYHMIEVEDLEPEDYIEYMTQVFDEAKGYLQFGHVSVSDTGSISVIGWDIWEHRDEFAKSIIEEIEIEKTKND